MGGQSANYAAKKDAQINPRMEECASGMGQSANYAIVKDAQTGFRLEEYALNMGQSANYAAQKDVEVMFRKEGCATSIGQSAHSNDGSSASAFGSKLEQTQSKPNEFASGTSTTWDKD